MMISPLNRLSSQAKQYAHLVPLFGAQKYPTSHTVLDTVRFGKGYGPTTSQLTPLEEGLKGFPNNLQMQGPRYFASPHLEQAMLDFISGNVSAGNIAQEMAEMKTSAMNTLALWKNKPLHTSNDYLSDAQDFLKILQTETQDIQAIFKGKFGFKELEIKILNAFIAKTAPILFSMGFPDAAAHSAQVCKLSVYKAYAISGGHISRLELLKEACVGLIHDPKLSPAVFSFKEYTNLATHPIVASVIAQNVCQDPAFNALLHQYPGTKVASYINGVVNALPINNDSKFVCDGSIIAPIKAQLKPDIAEQFQKEALARFEAPSKGVKPKPFSRKVVAALNGITMGTGLVGIRTQGLTSDEIQTLQKIIEGRITDTDTLSGLSQKLHEQKAFHETQVDALTLFCHHDEVQRSAKMAALALINSDPLLLTAHKILASGPESFLGNIASYTKSFGDNINYLPQKTRHFAYTWSRAMLVALANASDSLAGRLPGSTAEAIQKSSPSLESEIEALKQTIVAPETWPSVANSTKDQAVYNQGSQTVESAYLRIKGMFRDAAFHGDGSEAKVI
jgi:hypothetical protein